MPPAHSLLDAYDVWLGEAALAGRVVASVYRARIGHEAGIDAGDLDGACRALVEAPSIERERMKGSGPVRYDLRPFIEALEVRSAPAPEAITLRMALRHDPERGVGRPDEVLAAIASRMDVGTLPTSDVVRERLVLAPPPPPAPAKPKGPRRGGQPAAAVSRPRK